jgi:hypothetical protein
VEATTSNWRERYVSVFMGDRTRVAVAVVGSE